jgi:hypothetical protein
MSNAFKAVGSIFRSNKPPGVPSLPAQPPAPELLDVIDQIAGIETITVTGPDGKKRRVTQRLPLTKEEEETLSVAKNLINTAVNNIKKLYEYSPDNVANYKPFIDAFTKINNERVADLSQIGDFKDIAEKIEKFRNINRELSLKEFDAREKMAEERLSRRGLSRSTEATELRAAMAKDRALLEQQLDINAQNYGEELSARQLEREARLYEVREAGRASRLQEAETGYNLERQRIEDIEAARQNAINENINFLNVGQNIQGADNERARLALAGNQGAIAMFGAQAANQNQRFASDINRIQTQHAMDVNKFRLTPATFGQQIRDVGLAAAGAYAGGGLSGAMGGSPAAAGFGMGSRLRG